MSESAAYIRSAHSISFSYIPIASQCICLFKISVHWRQWGCIEQLFLVTKVDGHWVMLRLCPTHGRSGSPGVNGALGWPGRWPSAWWSEGLRKTWVAVWLTATLNYKTSPELSSPQSRRGFRKRVERQTLQPIFWYLLGEIARQFSSYISHTIPCFSLTEFQHFLVGISLCLISFW